MSSHKERLISFMKKEVGGFGFSNDNIKKFSSDLKALGILDMSKPETAEWLMNDKVGQSTLIALGTWYSLGLLSKIAEIKNITQGK